MNKRIFIALPVSQKLHPRISEFQKKYSSLPIRWIAPKNLHVTIIPPWKVHEITEITKTLKHFNRQSEHPLSSFTLSFTDISFGPNPRSPRLIWASGEAPLEFTRLNQSLETFLGKPKERRNSKVHITLARFHPEQFARFPSKTLNEPVNWRFQATSFVLMESRLSPQGADYEILATFTL